MSTNFVAHGAIYDENIKRLYRINKADQTKTQQQFIVCCVRRVFKWYACSIYQTTTDYLTFCRSISSTDHVVH